MRTKSTLFFLFILLSGLIFYGCGGRFQHDQLSFGIKAAQNELWDEAIFRWKKVLQVNPDSASAHNNLAVAYEKKGLWEEAEKEYKLALNLSPKNEHIQSNYEKFKKIKQGLDEEDEKKDEKKKRI